MKKLILILIALFIGVSAFSQDRTVTRKLDVDQTLLDYDGNDDDVIEADDTVAYEVEVNKTRPVLYNIQIDLEDEESVSGDYDVALEGKVFSTDSWSTIDDSNTAESGDVNLSFYSDESDEIDVTSADSEPFYRHFRIVIDGADISDGSAKVNYIYWKFYER